MRSTVACMAMVKMATGNKFSIDDAFESDEEDPIRVYGSTTESAPLRSKRRSDNSKDGREYTREVCGDPQQGLLQNSSERPSGRSESTRSLSTRSDSFSVATKTFPDKTHWWRHPKVRENWKIVLASFLLLIIGLGLIVAGIVIEASGSTAVQSYVFFIAGAICLIPGAYHVVYIYCAVKGKHGFSFYNFPVFR